MKTKSATFLMETELPWESAGEGMTRQIMGYDGQLMVVKVMFDTGAQGYAHAHFHSQATYVVSGKFEVTINGEKKVLSAGDGFYAEPDVLHGALCLEKGILIDVFSPMRLDFLKK